MSIFQNGKLAQQIARVTPTRGNDYELDIHAAAKYLVGDGRGDWRYLTHYSSGSTVWQQPNTDHAETVERRPERRNGDDFQRELDRIHRDFGAHTFKGQPVRLHGTGRRDR